MLHVLIGASCNNNCLFCMEGDRVARAAHVGAQSREDIEAMIASHSLRDEVLFTCGEPTLNPDLPHYAAWARQQGFRVVGIITNGRRLAYAGIARELVNSGVNRITISVHGHTARLHDSLTRSPGSFAQTRAGLLNMLRLRQTRPIEVQTATVVNQRNLGRVDAIRRSLAQVEPDVMIFNVMMPVGRDSRYFDALMPRYTDVADAFERLVDELSQEELGVRVRLVDLPVCVGRGLPAALWGEPERFEQYELLGSSGRSDQTLALAPQQGAKEGSPSPRLGQERGYYLTSRDLKESSLRTKEGPCRACAASPLCPGVYRRYAQVHGRSELSPITAEELASLATHFRPGSRKKKPRKRQRGR